MKQSRREPPAKRRRFAIDEAESRASADSAALTKFLVDTAPPDINEKIRERVIDDIAQSQWQKSAQRADLANHYQIGLAYALGQHHTRNFDVLKLDNRDMDPQLDARRRELAAEDKRLDSLVVSLTAIGGRPSEAASVERQRRIIGMVTTLRQRIDADLEKRRAFVDRSGALQLAVPSYTVPSAHPRVPPDAELDALVALHGENVPESTPLDTTSLDADVDRYERNRPSVATDERLTEMVLGRVAGGQLAPVLTEVYKQRRGGASLPVDFSDRQLLKSYIAIQTSTRSRMHKLRAAIRMRVVNDIKSSLPGEVFTGPDGRRGIPNPAAAD